MLHLVARGQFSYVHTEQGHFCTFELGAGVVTVAEALGGGERVEEMDVRRSMLPPPPAAAADAIAIIVVVVTALVAGAGPEVRIRGPGRDQGKGVIFGAAFRMVMIFGLEFWGADVISPAQSVLPTERRRGGPPPLTLRALPGLRPVQVTCTTDRTTCSSGCTRCFDFELTQTATQSATRVVEKRDVVKGRRAMHCNASYKYLINVMGTVWVQKDVVILGLTADRAFERTRPVLVRARFAHPLPAHDSATATATRLPPPSAQLLVSHESHIVLL